LGGNAECAAKGPLATVAGLSIVEHTVRHRCPGIAHRIFQKAEDPQPGTVASAPDIKIKAVGT
jgi:predicted secreted protein